MGNRRTFKPPYLKAWRTQRAMTQEQLAERIGCSVSLVSMVERGLRQYDQEFLERAADALGTSPDRLLRINPSDPASDDSIFEQIRRIPEGDRRKAMAVLEAFTAQFEHQPPAPRKVKPRKKA